jgi:hypothetical protein
MAQAQEMSTTTFLGPYGKFFCIFCSIYYFINIQILY